MKYCPGRIFGFDLIKTIAIFMIVFYHLDGIDYGIIEPGKYYLPNLNKFISGFFASSVPLFLMVNGALIVPQKLHWKQLFLKSVHLLFLLFFWKFVLQYLISFRLLSIQETMGHFWFLATLSAIYLISISLDWCEKFRKIILFGLLFFPFAYNLLLDLLIFFYPSSSLHCLKHTGFFTLYSILYFYLGYILRAKKMKPVLMWGLVISGIFLINFEVMVMSNYYKVIYDGVNSSFRTLGALFLSVGFFMLLKDVVFKRTLINTFFSIIGRNTMSIYLFHVLFIFLVRYYIIPNGSLLTPLQSIIVCLMIVAISCLFGNLISYSKLSFLLHYTVRKYKNG